jgi:DNA-3-methyladenine glycosylase II
MTNDVLMEQLTAIRGVGRWTVDMLLIFSLGHPDVLPVDDFGLREGYRLVFGLETQPRPRVLAETGTARSPHRSLAARYLWRAAEPARNSRLPQIAVC